jgi:CRISPR/Cas system-associated exonuclease Cas4 (RecB family)
MKAKPSVTDLCDMLAKPALINWANKQGLAGIDITATRRAAKSAGTSMHAQIEDGAFDDPAHAANYIRFAQDKEILCSEKKIETEWFTGRYDVLLSYSGRRWLCDYKKSNRHRIWFEHKLQLVAYSMAEPADGFAIIATPSFTFLPVEIDREMRSKIGKILIHLSCIWKLRNELENDA